ncbi:MULTISPECIES: hypothetical protein [Nocardia]|uniref:hypothetical protein n=1 Tax=Nocardia TaxID=1817 RepID=UPI0007EA199B|nr:MULTISPECIES: hypothetical protein [Nocardia]MBF6272963.1 hypothetical protein [Nocardia nova]OBA44150.1 hypothetical protein A5789_09790 [Nocardia sp. 852002-51101_SCH5132738]OBB49495.1 hypothetical protein A5748_19575 [Nocardia sp. 852002-51244_SCH5132740]OBF64941.1 hypothetical protein A9X06_08565 [Mycobacterium sp. 852002-51759_SCH5129042]
MTAEESLTARLDPAGVGMTRETVDSFVDTLTLTSSQAWTLCDILPPAEQLDHQWWDNAPAQLAAVVRARAREPHHGERWGVDHADLAEVCENLPAPHAVALVDAIVRARSVPGDYVEALRAVGLLR